MGYCAAQLSAHAECAELKFRKTSRAEFQHLVVHVATFRHNPAVNMPMVQRFFICASMFLQPSRLVIRCMREYVAEKSAW